MSRLCCYFCCYFSIVLFLFFLSFFLFFFFFFSSRRRHTRSTRDWSSDVLLFRSVHIVTVPNFSKAYSLCFQRVGYFVGSPRLIAALDKIRDSYNVNGLGQSAALATRSEERRVGKEWRYGWSPDNEEKIN